MKAYRFSGATLLSVDEKSRLLVPAEVRRKLDDEDSAHWIIKIGNNGKLWLYPEVFYNAKVFGAADGAALEIDEIDPAQAQIEWLISRSADIERVTMDKAGRILLPDLWMSLTGIGRGEVVLLGVFNHLQIWSKAAYAERQMQKSIEATRAATRSGQPGSDVSHT